jgi:hypothetical protein
MTKPETRRPKEGRNPTAEFAHDAPVGTSVFALLSDFGLRPSDFVVAVLFNKGTTPSLNHSPTPPLSHPVLYEVPRCRH